MNSLESLVSNNWSLVELELDLNEFDRQLQKMILSVAYIYKVLCYLPPVFDITFSLHLVYKCTFVFLMQLQGPVQLQYTVHFIFS